MQQDQEIQQESVPNAYNADGRKPWVIAAEGLHKAFDGTVVLHDFSLQVAPGEIFGLIGPSGSGKTTTIHLCCGHLQPSVGSLRVLGEEPRRFSRATRRKIGYMPQQFVLHPDLTVEQNVSFAAGLYGMAEWSSRARARIREVLELVELWPARARMARVVSGGMQRRIALAAALVHDPRLLFADEPTANLDPILRARLWQHFRALAEHDHTLFITTQYIDEAEYCDRVGLMYKGALIAQGQPSELRRQAFGGDVIVLTLHAPAPDLLTRLAQVQGVRATEALSDSSLRLTVDNADQAIPALIEAVEHMETRVQSIAPEQPTFDQVFIRLIEQHGERRPPLGQLQTSDAEAL